MMLCNSIRSASYPSNVHYVVVNISKMAVDYENITLLSFALLDLYCTAPNPKITRVYYNDKNNIDVVDATIYK